ncbi:hypothetical protein ACMFWY_06455, partial [Roseiconus sp. JC912]|uniref:hypothetical protein n=1 Tax=Roseiconus sp. JC912 TaxID=3396307 RepID=UPI003A4C587F
MRRKAEPGDEEVTVASAIRLKGRQLLSRDGASRGYVWLLAAGGCPPVRRKAEPRDEEVTVASAIRLKGRQLLSRDGASR